MGKSLSSTSHPLDEGGGVILGGVDQIDTGLVNTFRALGERRMGVPGIVAASVLGIASPLCMYGTIPIAASFSRGGIRDDTPMVAAISTPKALLPPNREVISSWGTYR